jgi:hypothetical protein
LAGARGFRIESAGAAIRFNRGVRLAFIVNGTD